jgi:CubicO group peptidase (beta-lactamase class C family)
MEQDASWMLDRSGHEQGGCCIQAITRDYARFGQFILDGARSDGRSIVAAHGS